MTVVYPVRYTCVRATSCRELCGHSIVSAKDLKGISDSIVMINNVAICVKYMDYFNHVPHGAGKSTLFRTFLKRHQLTIALGTG